jgi:hypothetical protein
MQDFIRRLRSQLSHETDKPHTDSSFNLAELPTPITRKVLMITHNPILQSQGGHTLKEHFGWNDSNALAQGYIEDIYYASYGYANYKIVERIEVDAYPVKLDGFRYNEASYLEVWKRRNFHNPDAVNYLALVREFEMIEKINSGAIDEVWLFGHPYGGYYESIMCGRNAFWCNAPPLADTEKASRLFVIMGFNFERGVGEMLEDLGHRAESMMYKVYERKSGERNLFERFIRYDKKYPKRAECGNVHFAPNSERDYDWGNPRKVLSHCDTWFNFPELSGAARLVNSDEWGKGDIRAHHVWWFRHFPHILGEIDGVSNNWWQYVIDPNLV